MEYYNKGFDADRPVQYKEIRREMAKVYDIDRQIDKISFDAK